jgi:2-polyprenyl-3-methyl-5-hydroxy-6-metoxy-1,4-benzoquinol methylase
VKPSHYSVEHYADADVAAGFDALRFGGPIGELVAAGEAQVLNAFTGDVAGAEVLDVGTGTARAALELARRGARVTGLDYSREMLGVGQARVARASVAVGLLRGDARHLPFPDRRFDVTVSLRLLMHVPDWRGCLTELCRVTRRRIVVDYPARSSAAALQAVGRRLLHGLGRPTEPYRVFTDRAIDEVCRAAGFRVRGRQRHFVLPIALHKSVGAQGFTRASEGALAAIGLRSIFGSPVTLVAEREA